MMRAAAAAFAMWLALSLAGCSDKPRAPGEGAAGASRRGDAGTAAGPADPGTPSAPVFAIAIAAPDRPGALVMERDVAGPVEDAIARVPGVASVTSAVRAGRVDAEVAMAPGTDATAAMGAIRAAVDGAASRLPAAVAPPELRLRATERVHLVATSETWTLDTMGSVRDRIATALGRTAGVRSVDSCGAADPVVRVIVDGDRLAAVGLDLVQMRKELSAAAAGVPSIEDLSGVILGNPIISLRDLATVERGGAEPRCSARVGGRPALSIQVGVDAAAGIDDAVRAVAAELPPDIRLARLAPAGGAVLEIGVDTPDGVDAAGLAELGRSIDARIAPVAGVVAVAVESGELPAAPGSLAPPSMRALVGLSAPARVDQVLAAARSPAAAVREAAPHAAPTILIVGDELEPLAQAGRAVAAALARTPGIAAAGLSGASLVPRARVAPDTRALAQHGVQPADVAAAIALASSGAHVGDLVEGGQRVPIRLEIAGPALERNPAAIAERLPAVRVRGARGLVPLSALAKVTLAVEPAAILRLDRRRAVEVWWQPAPGATVDAAAVRRAVDAVPLPAGIAIARP